MPPLVLDMYMYQPLSNEMLPLALSVYTLTTQKRDAPSGPQYVHINHSVTRCSLWPSVCTYQPLSNEMLPLALSMYISTTQ